MALDLPLYLEFATERRARLLSFAKGNLHKQSREEASDVVQSALMQVWRHRDENITNLRQYIYLAILQCCMDRNRRTGKYHQRFKLSGLKLEDTICPSSDSYTRAYKQELLSRVPARDRSAWLDAFESGSSRIAMPEGETQYFRVRVARTKKKLKALYAGA